MGWDGTGAGVSGVAATKPYEEDISTVDASPITGSSSTAVSSENVTEGAGERKQPQFRSTRERDQSSGYLDRGLVNRAKELLEGCDFDDPYEASFPLESLKGVIYDLWESAAESSEQHQEILAVLESAVLPASSLTEDQVSAFREAFAELSCKVLAPSDVDSIQSRFIYVGFSPLALLGDLEEDHERRTGE